MWSTFSFAYFQPIRLWWYVYSNHLLCFFKIVIFVSFLNGHKFTGSQFCCQKPTMAQLGSQFKVSPAENEGAYTAGLSSGGEPTLLPNSRRCCQNQFFVVVGLFLCLSTRRDMKGPPPFSEINTVIGILRMLQISLTFLPNLKIALFVLLIELWKFFIWNTISVWDV